MPIKGILAIAVLSTLLIAGCDEETTTGPNLAPNASFSIDPDGAANMKFTFDASEAIDSNTDGNIASYAWEFGDGATASGKVVTHIYDERDRYDVTLTVTDNAGIKDSFTRSIITGVVPEASFTATADEKYTNRYTFDASGSGEGVVTYQWDFGDGATATGKVVTHTFGGVVLEDQEVEVTLTIEDALGGVNSVTNSILVEAPYVPIPKTDWKAIDTDSVAIMRYTDGENEGEIIPRFAPPNLIDGNEKEFWNTLFRPRNERTPPPHFVTVDTRELHRMYIFKIVADDRFTGQNPENITIKFSDDGVTWSEEASFTTPFIRSRQTPVEMTFALPEPVEARYFKFIVTKNVSNPTLTRVAEVTVFTLEADAGM